MNVSEVELSYLYCAQLFTGWEQLVRRMASEESKHSDGFQSAAAELQVNYTPYHRRDEKDFVMPLCIAT